MGRWRSWADTLAWTLLALLPLALTGCSGVAAGPPGPPPGQLSITTTSLPSGTVGVAYSATLRASGGTTPYTWSISAGSLPGRLSLNAGTGEISGTPDTAGATSFTVRVNDLSSPQQGAAQTLSITINPGGPASLSITTTALPSAREGAPYQATLTATGGVTPYTWSIASGALPPGLTLGAASGAISGTPTQAGQFSFTVKVEDSSQPSRQSATKPFDLSVIAGQLDQYGGFVGAPCTGGATGLFYVEKGANGRWHFCTPDGNGFFMQGVYGLGRYGSTYANAVAAKYPSSDVWRQQTVLRLKSWGFNTESIYWLPEMTPISWGGGTPNPEKMPFIHIFRMAGRPALNRDGVGLGPVKHLANVNCTNPPAPHVSCNHALQAWGTYWDFYDPNFAAYANNMAKTAYQDQGTYPADFPNSWATGRQWCIGFVPDDSDLLTGFSGPGPDYPGRNGVIHPNPAHVLATAAPVQTNNTYLDSLGCTPAGSCNPYRDTTVYSKKAWRDYLFGKYGTIAALNATWGSDYTTFDVDKGYPRGTTGSKGLLDEDGSGSWLGSDLARQSGANPNVVADLNAFLQQYAEKFYQIVATAIRAANPGMLVFSNAPMNSNAGMTRREVLRAAGKYLDVIEVQHDPTRPVIAQETYKEAGRPMVTWTGLTAQADSPWAGNPPPEDYLNSSTQQGRGVAYATEMSSKVNLQASDGSYPYIGTNFWEWLDLPRERANWGLVTLLDNAYDGREAIIAKGTDPWGYPTGGETNNYGDFISAVKAANMDALKKVLGIP